MRRRTLVVLAVVAASLPFLVAAMTIQMDSISADGMELRDLSCDVEQGGFLAPTLVVAALATHKADIDACAPTGAAFSLKWSWTSPTPAVEVTDSSDRARDSCIADVIGKAEAPVVGSCSAILLAGEATAAANAATALQAKAASPSTP